MAVAAVTAAAVVALVVAVVVATMAVCCPMSLSRARAYRERRLLRLRLRASGAVRGRWQAGCRGVVTTPVGCRWRRRGWRADSCAGEGWRNRSRRWLWVCDVCARHVIGCVRASRDCNATQGGRRLDVADTEEVCALAVAPGRGDAVAAAHRYSCRATR